MRRLGGDHGLPPHLVNNMSTHRLGGDGHGLPPHHLQNGPMRRLGGESYNEPYQQQTSWYDSINSLNPFQFKSTCETQKADLQRNLNECNASKRIIRDDGIAFGAQVERENCEKKSLKLESEIRRCMNACPAGTW